MRSRNWSIRAKIISLLLIPLTALILLWAIAMIATLGPSLNRVRVEQRAQALARPAGQLMTVVQAERRTSLQYLADGRRDADALVAVRNATASAAATLRSAADGQDLTGADAALIKQRLSWLLDAVDGLPQLRGGVDRGELDRATTLRRYSSVIDAGFLLLGSLVVSPDQELEGQARALLGIARAHDVLSQEDAVVTAAVTAGTASTSELAQVVQLIGAQRIMFTAAMSELHPTDRTGFEQLIGQPTFTSLTRIENKVLADGRAGAALPVDAPSWTQAMGAVELALWAFERQAGDRLVARTNSGNSTSLIQIISAGLLGLIAVVVTMVASFRMGRSLIKRLAGLRQAALELAVDRLPRVVARLRRGEQVNVAAEAPALPYGEDEIGQVGHAFNELQRTAVNSAVEEAALRSGLNEVFLNIARRSQTLLHRQLSILDNMERRTEDPTELEDLFRIDHLATRMRRHAEDLVILAGAVPGRGWRNPIPVVDVLRGAISEVEDFARVSLRPMPEAAIVGRAVGDLIHLLAELIENATSFSPPHTRVNVGAELVASGFAIEIEDRGLGMPPPALDECNERLANPPEFDPANSAQLGLFVVARLADRHGIRVQLRSSPYGGITAVVLLPEDIVTTHAEPGRLALPAPSAISASASALSAPPLTTPLTAAPLSPAAPGPAFFSAAPPASAPVDVEIVDSVPPTTAYSGEGGGEEPNGAAKPGGRRPRLPKARHSRTEIIEPEESERDGLPRRVRQTSLSALRDTGGDEGMFGQGPRTGDNPTKPSSGRSPEEIRAMMNSFQSGMARGRRDAEAEDDYPGGAP